jgi:hypothetical protein
MTTLGGQSIGRDVERELTPGRVLAERDGWCVEVDVEDLDRLGASVHGIRVRAPHPGSITRQAERFPETMRALPERLVPLEVEPRLGGAVLRSDPEDMRGRDYYEVRTDGREASLGRMRIGPDGRERIPFTVTREQLGRLVDGMGEAMGEE